MTTLNGQVIGQAERATRAVLDRMLEREGVGFERWVALNLAATVAEGRRDLEARMVDGLRLEPAYVTGVVDGAVSGGLLTEDAAVTPEGRARFASITAGIAALTQRLYGDVPAKDLEVAGRVLTLVTARAGAELSSSAAGPGGVRRPS